MQQKKIWTAPGLKSKITAIPELHSLITDFVNYKKQNLSFNDEKGYLNIKYLIGKDVPYDIPPLMLDNLFHTHVIEKGSPEYNRAKKPYNRHIQEKWTSNYALVYCTYWLEDNKSDIDKEYFGILDFWLDAHSHFNTETKLRMEKMINEFEKAVQNGDVVVW